MLVIAAGFTGGYYVLGTKSEARAATTTMPVGVPGGVPVGVNERIVAPSPGSPSELLRAYPTHEVAIKTASGVATMTWAELGIEVDPDEVGRSPLKTDADLAALGAKGSIPVRLDRDKAVAALIQLKHKHDKSPNNAYLDLETREIHGDTPGLGIDVWSSLPRIASAARQGAAQVELVTISVPATVTKAGLGIDDISQVLGHYLTKFPVTDRDRNFNLKLAASKINGAVLKPGEEWSFNGTVGERSEKEGYKIAHVITAGEMVDGLAGGTCQISTTLFGAAFFAGIDIVKTTNHSRPSVYTPLGFDATVVWPDTDLKLKNSYEFPVVIHYRVANGEALVEILGKKRPYDKIVFERKVIEQSPFSIEERLDDEMPEGQTSLDQVGFDGYKLERFRRFYNGGKLIKSNKWTVNYKPVTEYVRRGTSTDPAAKMPVVKEAHGPKAPTSEEFKMAQ